jgi:hypothetical protein
MANREREICAQFQLIQEFEWFSHHSIEMQIPHFGAISSVIQM